MLSADYLLHVSEGAEQIATQLHTAILKQIIVRIQARQKRGLEYLLTARDKWAIQNALDAGYMVEDIQKEIAKYTGLQTEEIRAAMLDAGVKALSYDDAIYKAAGLTPTPLKQSPFIMRLMERNYEKTVVTWENYTGTLVDASQQAFIETMDEAYNMVSTGNLGYIQAYTEAIDKLATDGITMVTYARRRDTIETAALRCIRTGVAQMSGEICLGRMEEMGCDLVLTSSHAGARPEHQEWQGRVFSRSGQSDKYPDFISSTGYGTVTGLCGANCRHSVSPYFEGMENPFKHYDTKADKKLYEETQQQRAIERGIRKEEKAAQAVKYAYDNTDDPEAKKSLSERYQKHRQSLKEKKALYQEFCDKHKLRPLPERLKVAQVGRQRPEDAIEIESAVPIASAVPETPIVPTVPVVKPKVDQAEIERRKAMWKQSRSEQDTDADAGVDLDEYSTETKTFTEAKTLKEAEQFASTYSHHPVTINEKMRLGVVNGFNEAAFNVSQRFGIKLDIASIAPIKATKYMQASYNPLTKQIKLVNSSMSIYEKKAEKLFESKWDASNDKYGTFYHEIGHAIWGNLPSSVRNEITTLYTNVKHESFLKWKADGASHSRKTQADLFGDILSKYAIQDEKEFFSEAFSQIMSGRMKKVSREVNAILRKYFITQ